MSWAEEDWTVGLSGRVLQKVKELQVHHERLSRENKQKQLQLDNIHASLEKQVVKYDEVRGELNSVQRELQSVREEAKGAVISRERLTQDLQTKQAQVCSLEGQLDATRTLLNKLTQEVKRLEAELEKLQDRNKLSDTTLFSTPCWSTSSPWEQHGSRNDEERSGHQDETQSQAPHVRQRLQFSDMHTNSLPRQHKSTPHHRLSDQSESYSTPLAVFPWERDDTRQTARRQSPSSPQAPCADIISQGQPARGHLGKGKDNKTEMDISLSEMQSRVSCLEEELSVKAKMITSIQSNLGQTKKEVAAQEISLQKARCELSLAHTRITQESERASGAEQRLKQLQEELKCQRQNAESSRLQHQQRSKEMEKQHQRDVIELQKERQQLEKQHREEVNKLNQELQQARTLHNALQAQADKLSLQKQVLDKELDMLKEKVKWTEGQLQESQKKEAQTQAKLTEALREAEGVAVSLEQSRKRERGLEEEGRRLSEERADALRLLKDLQEQKAAPAPPVQPVQFCPGGQSLYPPPSYPLHSRQPTHTKKPTIRAEQKKEEDVDERGAELPSPYPSEREPGEGIDAEHISVLISTEALQREAHRRKSDGENNNSRNEMIKCDSSGTKGHSTFGDGHSSVSHSAPDVYTDTSVDASCSVRLSDGGTPSVKPEQTKASEDLRRENAVLRSEINDVREELQKRLDDLEAQRRAEAEARTRLKQLSRKHASHAVEKAEQDKEWKAKLESERAEVDRLMKAMLGLETEVKSRKEEREKKEREDQEEEKNKALEDRESEMIELNIQLKKQLADVKAQLALEREERQHEDEERNQASNLDADVKEELSTKLAELQAELEELKCSKKEDERAGEEKLLLANSPLTYLSLHDDELNSNIVHRDKLVLSPEQHLLFCQSTNQLNTLVSQGTADFIQKQTVIDPECSPLSDEGQAYQIPSDLEDTRQNCLGETFLSDQRDDISLLHKCESAPSHLENEVARLHKEKAQETERANQNQVKLEALQNQVTRQTRQLTMAFEKQSQHISGLLAELHEKEIALLRQGEEMQRYKLELDVLQTEKEVEKGQREGRLDVKSTNPTEFQPTEENDCAATVDAVGSTAKRDDNQTKSDPRTHVRSEEDNVAQLLDSDKAEDNHGSICRREETEYSQDGRAAHDAAELLALLSENCLLKQRIESLTVSDTGGRALHTDTERKEDPVELNTGHAVVSCSTEQGPSSQENDITTEGQESLLQNERREEDGDLEREDKRTKRAERTFDEVSHLQIKHLEQQVVALQGKVRALSEETQQQNEELELWRLASQPAPTFDQILPIKDDHYQISAVGQSQSNQQHTDETTHDPTGTKSEALADHIRVIRQSPSNVTVIREDELLLSCSSNKLQGQMLSSRLQHNNIPEPSFQYLKKTAALKEHNQYTVNIDEESEKENQERNVLQSQRIDKRDAEVIQMSSETTGQHITKGLNNTKTQCHSENPKISRASDETNTTGDSLKRAVRTEMKSVYSQTEQSVCPPTASKLHTAYTQTEEEEVDSVDSPSVSPTPLSEAAVSGEKMLFSGSFPIPADPARLAERIRRNRTQLSAAFDDTEYEPYGLPEVVMKGFADIPTGPSCPYIVRRGLLGTSVVPVPQKDTEKEEETD